MFFFKSFPNTDYHFPDIKNSKRSVTDITKACFLRKAAFEKTLFSQNYGLKDIDIPESLSVKLYGSTLYYWTFLIVNDVIDPYAESLINRYTLVKFVENKYKNGITTKLKDGTNKMLSHSIGIDGIHHFLNVQTGDILDDYYDEIFRAQYTLDPENIDMNILPITNLAYEAELNEKRRRINIVNPSLIGRFETDFQNSVGNQS